MAMTEYYLTIKSFILRIFNDMGKWSQYFKRKVTLIL